ncbi:hypothetical protein STEG23_034113 [Scotinomys teguina]
MDAMGFAAFSELHFLMSTVLTDLLDFVIHEVKLCHPDTCCGREQRDPGVNQDSVQLQAAETKDK